MTNNFDDKDFVVLGVQAIVNAEMGTTDYRVKFHHNSLGATMSVSKGERSIARTVFFSQIEEYDHAKRFLQDALDMALILSGYK